MAHVLLPCDLPTWPDVQRHLSQMKFVHSPEQLVVDMQKIYDVCCVGLDPEDPPKRSEEVRFDLLKAFFKQNLTPEERRRFFDVTLPYLVSSALKLKLLKPTGGFQYSLQQQEAMFSLERKFLASLVANAFFSTFPKRTFKTHPTLQDFNYSDLFQHLNNAANHEKLKKLFGYFDCLIASEPKGSVHFCRQVIPERQVMTLPEWLCSDCPLCPMLVRTRGKMEESEPILFKAYPCSSRIGGEVLRDGTSQECCLFTSAPEMLVTLAFAESLQNNESFTIDGILPLDHRPQEDGEPALYPWEISVCLLDCGEYSKQPQNQFEDGSLLRELNKCLVAFRQALNRRRPSPVGRSSSSSAGIEHHIRPFNSSSKDSSLTSFSSNDSPDRVIGEPFGELSRQKQNQSNKKAEFATSGRNSSSSAFTSASSTASKEPMLKSILGALKKESSSTNHDSDNTAVESSRTTDASVVERKCATGSDLKDSKKSVSIEENSSNKVLVKRTDSARKSDRLKSASSKEGKMNRKPSNESNRKSLLRRKSSGRSLTSSSSRESLDDNRMKAAFSDARSLFPIMPSASAPLLTQAVLCAKRHPSPRPERKSSGPNVGMVFRPIQSPSGPTRWSDSPCSEKNVFVLSSSPSQRPLFPIGISKDPSKPDVIALHRISPEERTTPERLLKGSKDTKGLASVKLDQNRSSPVAIPRPPQVPIFPLVSQTVAQNVSESPKDSVLRKEAGRLSSSPVSRSRPLNFKDRFPLSPNTDRTPTKLSSSPKVPSQEISKSLSWPRISVQISAEDDYYTAEESLDESMDEGSSPVRAKQHRLRTRRERSSRTQTSESSIPTSSRQPSREDSVGSAGFHLDAGSGDEEGLLQLSSHERYEDFRRRIKRRNRRLARRNSRSSRHSSSGSSDMDDILEDPELGFSSSTKASHCMRSANSEPMLFQPKEVNNEGIPALAVAPELITSSPGRRQMMMTTGQGKPKAYSFDGVNPNLPVPFKARFRCRDSSQERGSMDELFVTVADTAYLKQAPVASPEASSMDSLQSISEDSPHKASSQESDHNGSAVSGSREGRADEEDCEEPVSSASNYLQPTPDGVRPVATCRWSRDDPTAGDAQLEAVIQWLAASMARVPSFVVYTGGDPRLEQMAQIGYKAEERRWSVGDLACETLRYCRNKMAIFQGRNKGKISSDLTLFSQMLNTGTFESHDSLE